MTTMTLVKASHTRLAILIGAAILLLLGSIPLISNAQDAATPEAGMTEQQLIEEGEQIYMNVCIACHQPDGKGIAGIYLPLNGNPLVTNDDPTYLITTLLNGRGGMPRFDTTFSDEEIAAVSSYVRQNWDNDAAAVSAEEVSDVREQFEMTTPTPEAQIPAGQDQATPEASPAP